MKLLELIVNHRIDIPSGAKFIVQDHSRLVYTYKDLPVFDGEQWNGDGAYLISETIDELSDDYASSVVSVSEYMLELDSRRSRTRACDVNGSRSVGLDEKTDPVLLAAVETEAMDKPCDPQWRQLRTKADSAATVKQAKPSGQGNPILGMVLADLTNRALEGKEKYGEPLKAHNGRNALWDAYQEALDLAMYLRQAIEEQSK